MKKYLRNRFYAFTNKEAEKHWQYYALWLEEIKTNSINDQLLEENKRLIDKIIKAINILE